MRGLLSGFIIDRNATTAIEYGLIAALISLVMISGLHALGDSLSGQMIVIGTSLNN
jgi:pilus assembly protein Flp/PilA